VDRQNIGEIDSIYVEPAYRKRGIGECLMQKALMWLDGEHVASKRLVVVVGNEHVSAFYRKFGFFPQSIVFAQKTA
jgi:ribosomal protein S18 acetylase RimI-like enzyme